jgi:hypothetical protein
MSCTCLHGQYFPQEHWQALALPYVHGGLPGVPALLPVETRLCPHSPAGLFLDTGPVTRVLTFLEPSSQDRLMPQVQATRGAPVSGGTQVLLCRMLHHCWLAGLPS